VIIFRNMKTYIASKNYNPKETQIEFIERLKKEKISLCFRYTLLAVALVNDF